MTKKSWVFTVVALIAVSLISIGGVIYYGTFVQPGERVAADKRACDNFASGLVLARNNAVAVAKRTPAGTDQEVADAYIKAFDNGLSKAFDAATKDSDVYKSFAQMSLTRISYDASMGLDAITAIESQFSNAQASCSVVEPTATPSATK